MCIATLHFLFTRDSKERRRALAGLGTASHIFLVKNICSGAQNGTRDTQVSRLCASAHLVLPATRNVSVETFRSGHRLASFATAQDMLRRTKWNARHAGVSLFAYGEIHFVPPRRIELLLRDPQSRVLSVERRGQPPYSSGLFLFFQLSKHL